MNLWLSQSLNFLCRMGKSSLLRRGISLVALTLFTSVAALAEPGGGEAALKLPDLSSVSFFNGAINGHKLLLIGILFCVFGLLFGLVIYIHLKNLPVHRSMREISELIYETCKTYLVTQGKFILMLWVFIAVIIAVYFGWLAPVPGKPVAVTLPIILFFSLVGIAGSYGVAWFGIRVNTFANSRTAFAGLRGKPFPIYDIPLQAGMSIGMMLISVELLMMLFILLFIPGDYAGPCFIGFAIGESLGAAALRIAGGIFTKIADIGSDLMKIVFKIKEDDARNPGVIADCTGDNAGDSVGPTADGFETYGVTGVALITFILLGVKDPMVQVQLLVWIFVMRVMMLVASAGSYFLNGAIAKARYGNSDKMNFEAPLTSLVWLTSFVSIVADLRRQLPDDSRPGRRLHPVVEAGFDHLLRHPGRRADSGTGEGLHLDLRAHVQEVVTSSREGGASLSILSGFVAGNFSAYWLGLAMVVLMSIAYFVSMHGLGRPDAGSGGLCLRPGGLRLPGHGTGDHRGRFLRPGDRQRPVGLRTFADRAGSERRSGDQEGIRLRPELRPRQGMLEENDGAGNTFKATAKPVLIGTAVVGATTMIFSIIMALTHGLHPATFGKLSLLHAPSCSA